MRVLLSAYACEPDRGSEPEVGWQRALHMLPFADEVWVLTRANNKQAIEANSLSHNPKLLFIYYDLPKCALQLKKQAWFLPLYFMLWQLGAYKVAKRHHRVKPFDAVFHVTFASLQFGSFMGRLGIPFTIGPIAGGERAPLRLRKSLPAHARLVELLRDLKILLQRYNPLARSAIAAAERIYVTTKDSQRLIPSKWWVKTRVCPAIAAPDNAAQHHQLRIAAPPEFVYAGNLLYLKGLHLAIYALAKVINSCPGATLTLIGDGPAKAWLQACAARCGVTHAIRFAGRIPRQKLQQSFTNFTALVFPSFHDSGGMAVLEALSVGIPVVCLDLGGPGVLINDSCGIVVSTKNANENQVISRIASAMITLSFMPANDYATLSKGAIVRANKWSWNELTKCVLQHKSGL